MSTARDVAKRAGVSATTVTRILNNDPRYSYKEETRQMVLEAAEELAYMTSRKRKAEQKAADASTVLLIATKTIAVVIEGVQQACDALGYNLLIRISASAEDEEYVPYLESGAVDAVIFFDYGVKGETIARFPGVPFVQINKYYNGPDMVSVTVDEGQALEEIVGFLREKGRDRIAMASYSYVHEMSVPVAKRRRLGLEAALLQEGFQLHSGFFLVDTVDRNEGNDEDQQILKELRKLLQLPEEERPNGLICNGARLAALCLRTIQEEGLRVPEDVALVCSFSDEYTSLNVLEVTNPTISGLFVPLREMGCAAVYAVTTMLEHPEICFNGITLPYQLIFRKSTPE